MYSTLLEGVIGYKKYQGFNDMNNDNNHWIHLLGGILCVFLSFVFLTKPFFMIVFSTMSVFSPVTLMIDSILIHTLFIILFSFGSVALYFYMLFKTFEYGVLISKRI